MDFQHNGDRQLLRETLGRFLSDRYRFDIRQKAAENDLGFDPEIWRELAELGFVGAMFDSRVGGFAGGGFDLLVIFEQLGRSLVIEPFLPTLMVGRALEAAGGQAELVGAIVGGKRVALAHDEPGGRYAFGRVTTTARAEGDRWILSGAKCCVAQAAGADLLLISARTRGMPDAPDGIALFLVEHDASGMALQDYPNIDGGNSADIRLTDVSLPPEALVASPHDGFGALKEARAAGLLALSAEAVGAMDVARDMTVEYLRTRVQFGVPIGSFQALQHRMATMLIEIEQARSAVINAAAAFDEGPSHARDRALSAAKYTIGRVGCLVAEESIQMHGGIGMTWELPLSHYAKRLVMIGHMLGDEDVHLQEYINFSRRIAMSNVG